jgi:Uma2 family endonuclease
MSMPALSEPTYWTAAMVRELPDDGKRYECIDGELLVTPSPRWKHQDAVGGLYMRLRLWLAQEPIGKVTMSPADVEIVPGTLVQPDVFVVPLREDGRLPQVWTDIRTLLLAIEVLSPSTARYDRVTKRRFFARAGVPEYWIVDVDARVIERWTPSDERPEILGEDAVLEWCPTGARTPFTIPLAAFFAEVLADYAGE